jgi:Cu/Ag efflux protein CusF
MSENREVSMKLAKLVLTGSLLIGMSSLAWAQATLTGTVTTIDRLSGTIAIEQTQGGTVGASAGGATEQQFKASDDLLEKIHAGDKVTVSVTDSGGKKTITKIDRQ